MANSRFSLGHLARELNARLVPPSAESLEVQGVTCTSQHQQRESLFVAIRGSTVDGHLFIGDAASSGSIAVVVDQTFFAAASERSASDTKQAALPYLVVTDTRWAFSRLAAIVHGHPSRELTVVGVTGTNGKTTINWLVYNLFRELGIPALRMGTLGLESELGLRQEGTLTTPDPLEVQANLARAKELGVRACVMEVSSHALDQRRVDEIDFDVAIYTNLSRDHLDYHGTMESYFAAKERLFKLLAEGYKATRAAVVNVDCTWGGEHLIELVQTLSLRDFSYGFSSTAKIRIDAFEQTHAGSVLRLSHAGRAYTVGSALLGRHNASNIAATFSCCLALGENPERICELMPRIPQVPGRLELIRGNGPKTPAVFVDYAHTPDALENVLHCLRELKPNRLWVVFGCGGDRDRGKRPRMAAIAKRLSDRVVVTSDNPRREDPDQIIAEILSGPEGQEIMREGIVEPDRRRAIEMTLERADADDIVLIAGKGHEDYQIIGSQKFHFSDQEEVMRVLGI